MAYALLIAWRWLRGSGPVATDAGHWFLAIHGTYSLLGWIESALAEIVGEQELFTALPRWYYMLQGSARNGFLMTLALTAAIRIQVNHYWRAMLLLLAARHLESLALSWTGHFVRGPLWFASDWHNAAFTRLVYSLPALAALMAAVVDLRRGRSHDFIHWAGVWTLLLLVALEWPFWLWWWQVFR
jgi:hypothetical protein